MIISNSTMRHSIYTHIIGEGGRGGGGGQVDEEGKMINLQ